MMENYFDHLSMQAMELADDALSNIAETEMMSEEETQRILNMTLQKAGLTVSCKPVVKRRSGIRRVGVFLLSAALAAAVLGVTVSGYMRYNEKLVQKNFGVLGTSRLEDMNLPEAVRYTNGAVNLAVEAVLCDGKYALVLITMTAAEEGAEIDWENSFAAYEFTMDDPDDPKQTLYGYDNAIRYYSDYQIMDDQCWVTWFYEVQDNAEDAMTLQFYQGAAAGIDIEILLKQNIPVLTLASEDGVMIRLSGYQIYMNSWDTLRSASTFELHRSDGSQTTCHMPSALGHGGRDTSGSQFTAHAKIYESIEGVEFDQNDPSTFIGYLDISDVEYITMGGTNYYVQD